MIARTTLNTLILVLISIIPNVSLGQSLVVHPVINGMGIIDVFSDTDGNFRSGAVRISHSA